jgi:ABC-type Fe3+-siderophore transport system permease subunit
MIGLTHSLHPSLFHHNYKSLLWQTIDTVWMVACVGVTITMLCVLSPCWFREQHQPFRILRQWFMLAGVLGRTRVVSGYTTFIVQQHNGIYQHFSSFVGINIFTGA